VDVEDKQKNTALHIAARHGHASVTKTLACNGAHLMRRGAGGMLPVHMACLSGYSDCVETLIPRGESCTTLTLTACC
jgi:ankyrin repeat protein